MCLTKPDAKMSKSNAEPSSILLTDSRATIFHKVNFAVTDSIEGDVTYDPANRPGVSNLIEILYHIKPDGAPSREAVASALRGLSKRAFKQAVADAVDKHLEPIRERYQGLVADSNRHVLAEVSEKGAQRARQSADVTMDLVRDTIGLSA